MSADEWMRPDPPHIALAETLEDRALHILSHIRTVEEREDLADLMIEAAQMIRAMGDGLVFSTVHRG